MLYHLAAVIHRNSPSGHAVGRLMEASGPTPACSGRPAMVTESAGLVIYRAKPVLEFLLIHMGGPYWARKEEGAWSLPKGVVAPGEQPLAAAIREAFEETGFCAEPPFHFLGRHRQNSGKNLSVWATPGSFDPASLRSSLFELEWPPRSGQMQSFPEADRASWFTSARAKSLIVRGQRKVLDTFLQVYPSFAASARAKKLSRR